MSKCFWCVPEGIPCGISWAFGSGVSPGFHGRHDLHSQMYLYPSWIEMEQGLCIQSWKISMDLCRQRGIQHLHGMLPHLGEEIWTGKKQRSSFLVDLFKLDVMDDIPGFWAFLPALNKAGWITGPYFGVSCCMNPLPVQLSMISLSKGWHWLLSLIKA